MHVLTAHVTLVKKESASKALSDSLAVVLVPGDLCVVATEGSSWWGWGALLLHIQINQKLENL